MGTVIAAFEKTVTWIGNIGMWLTVPLMLIICAEVLLRSTIGYSIIGIHETTEFLLVVFVFLCMASTYVRKAHVTVTLVTDLLPSRARTLVDAAMSLIGSLIWFAVAWQTLTHGRDVQTANVISPTIGVPLFPFLLVTAFGAALTGGVLLIASFRLAAGRRTP